MFTILIHSSKTMRAPGKDAEGSVPQFIAEARELAEYVGSLDTTRIARAMDVSPALAAKTLELTHDWTDHGGLPALDAFTGDIYSGLQVASLTNADHAYADDMLVILSGLYGLLRPLDLILPYRLEMGYKFPDPPYDNLYRFWDRRIADALPRGRTIVNVSSAEYTKAVLPYVDACVVTPKFLTVSPKTGEPVFVTVHAKIARGAFAHWLIVNRVEDEARLTDFNELGYAYDADLSTDLEPVFVAREFGGLGLSVRLK